MTRIRVLIMILIVVLARPAYCANAAAQQGYERGLKRMQAKDYNGASAEFSGAIFDDPTYVEAQLQLANCYYYVGEKEKALATYEEYLDKRPADTKTKAFVDSLRKAGERKISDYGKGSDKCYLKGMEFMKVKDYKLAQACFIEGLGYDEQLTSVMGGPWAGVLEAERKLAQEAGERGKTVAEVRKERQERFDAWLAAQTKDQEQAQARASARSAGAKTHPAGPNRIGG